MPYGSSDFKRIICENYAYEDKTKYIEMPENETNPNLFFIRPRKFGKSLFFTTLLYCKTGAGEAEVTAQQQKGKEQIEQYPALHRLSNRSDMKAAVIVFMGKNEYRIGNL
jgi:hypothetical protein